MKSIQYTIRSVPDRVDRELRRRAQQNKSLNTVIVEALAQATNVAAEPVVYHDLDHLIGTWVEDPAFDEAMQELENTDPEDWR